MGAPTHSKLWCLKSGSHTSCKYFLNMEKSWDSFYNYPVGQSTPLESMFSLGFHVYGHLSPNHLPGLWLTSYSPIPFLLFLVTLVTPWFQPHLIYFPWPAGTESWPHCHIQHVLPQDLTTSSCLATWPWPPTSLCFLAFSANLCPLQCHSDLANCSRSLEPHLQGWENTHSVTKKALFWHLKHGRTNPSGPSEYTASGTS